MGVKRIVTAIHIHPDILHPYTMKYEKAVKSRLLCRGAAENTETCLFRRFNSLGEGNYESVGSDNNTRVVYTYTRRYRSACGWGEFSLEVQLYLSPCAFCCAGRRQLEKWARHPLYLLLIWYICGVRVLVFLYYQMNRHCRPRCIPPTVKYM